MLLISSGTGPRSLQGCHYSRGEAKGKGEAKAKAKALGVALCHIEHKPSLPLITPALN